MNKKNADAKEYTSADMACIHDQGIREGFQKVLQILNEEIEKIGDLTHGFLYQRINDEIGDN